MDLSRTVAILGVLHCVVSLPVEARAANPDFFWLPPTVPVASAPTGPFDATLLDELVVEVCELGPSGDCVAGPPIERFTSVGTPVPTRISLDERREFYSVDW